jgi:hypothetical protein
MTTESIKPRGMSHFNETHWSLLIAAGVGLLLCLAYVSYCRNDIRISRINWAQLGDKYKIQFHIENRSNRLLEAQINIVAGRLQGAGDGQVFQQIGHEPMTVILEPREKKNIEHDVVVTQWGPFVNIINVKASSGR